MNEHDLSAMTERLPVVLSAAESAAADEQTIAAGVPSRALMQRAGAAAAAEIAHRYADRLARGVLLFAGPGNNGGDAWVVARALTAAGVRCRVCEVIEARTADARAERELAAPLVEHVGLTEVADAGTPGIVVDGVLGTGATGALRGVVADAVSRMAALRASGEVGGAPLVALDLPSGLDATSGDANGAVQADLTLAFGTLKRGHLLARERCGTIVSLEIGLLPRALPLDAPHLVLARWVQACVPPIRADAHKGDRGKVAIVGGARGMAGAAVLAGRAALASGAGMVRLVVAPESLPAVQSALVEATASAWPDDDTALDAAVTDWADVLLVGPGLGGGDDMREFVERLLARWRGPVVLDADALNVFAGDADALAALLDGGPALITPHPLEFARLSGHTLGDVKARRFDIGAELAQRIGATVLLKGVPTVISDPAGTRWVSAAGTPALATAGSGDVLAGIAAALAGQMDDLGCAAACAAWAHGRAAELTGRDARGVVLDDVLHALPRVWGESMQPSSYPAVVELASPR